MSAGRELEQQSYGSERETENLMIEDTYDAVVVGSGAAGSFAAKTLTEQGLKVLLLEAGRTVDPKEFEAARKQTAKGNDNQLWPRVRATLGGQPLQARVAFFNEQLKGFFVKDWLHPYKTARKAPFLWIRGRQVGGRLHVFGRVLFRWTDADFKGKDYDGKGVNWPISYGDVEPYYCQVERFLKLHGNPDGVASAPDGCYDQPAKLTAEEKTFKVRVEERWKNRHVTSWRYILADADPMPQAVRAALATGRLTLRSDAVVTRVLVDQETLRATGVEYADRTTRQRYVVKARTVVLCASVIETIRLLLNSASRPFPKGLANSSGLVGRYFMDQCVSLVFGSFPSTVQSKALEGLPQHPLYGVTGGVYIPRYNNWGNVVSDVFARGYTFQGSIGRRGQRTDQVDISVMGFGEMLPYFDNCVTLDPARVDRWGVPLPRIHCVMHENERLMLQTQTAECAEMIEASGGKVDVEASALSIRERGRGLFPDAGWLSRMIIRRMFPRSLVMGAAIHESGGVRMGDDPKTSVLNRYNQSWDVPNLFVTDASSFPSGGSVGTTLTVMALTVRACEYLATELKAGRL